MRGNTPNRTGKPPTARNSARRSMIKSLSSAGMISLLEESEDVVDLTPLYLGEVFLKFSQNGRAHERLLQLTRDNKYIVWVTPWWILHKGASQCEVDLEQVKRIQQGQMTAPFERHKDYFGNLNALSFSLIYGDDCSLDLVAPSKSVFQTWYLGLKYLLEKNRIKHDMLDVSLRFNAAKFEQADSDHNGRLSKKEISQLMTEIGIHKPNDVVDKLFKEVDVDNSGTLNFHEFCRFMELIRRRPDLEYVWTLLHLNKLMSDELEPLNVELIYSEKDLDRYMKRTLPLPRFLEFWNSTQNEELTIDQVVAMVNEVKAITGGNLAAARKAAIRGSHTNLDLETEEMELAARLAVASMSFHVFVAIIMHKNNDVFDPLRQTRYQDMTHPLSHYYIASSHNTYLEGDQFSSKSSVNRYIDDLCKNCRCVEIDCWDGDDGNPIVYHGHTLTTKIKFEDVIIAIRNYAFTTSPYPVILSIENHCSLDQQKRMADIFKSVLGKLLMQRGDMESDPSSPDYRDTFPSPEQLKYKVIIKGKRQEGDDDVEDEWDDDFFDEELPPRPQSTPREQSLTRQQSSSPRPQSSPRAQRSMSQKRRHFFPEDEPNASEITIQRSMSRDSSGSHVVEKNKNDNKSKIMMLLQYSRSLSPSKEDDNKGPSREANVKPASQAPTSDLPMYAKNVDASSNSHGPSHSQDDANDIFFLPSRDYAESNVDVSASGSERSHSSRPPSLNLKDSRIEISEAQPVSSTDVTNGVKPQKSRGLLWRRSSQADSQPGPATSAAQLQDETVKLTPAALAAAEKKKKSSFANVFSTRRKSTADDASSSAGSRPSRLRSTSSSVGYTRQGTKLEEIHQDLSDITYIGGMRFDRKKGFRDSEYTPCYLMSSFKESLMLKMIEREPQLWIKHNIKHLSRIYPRGSRVDSSNFDPVPSWCVGTQLVALNYQTPGLPMQINDGKFRENGNSGYVLKPEFLNNPLAKPDDPIVVGVHVLSGQNFPRPYALSKDARMSPYVTVNIHGATDDCKEISTGVVQNNGFNPIFDEVFSFTVHTPELAQITFRVYVQDESTLIGETKGQFLGYYSIPLTCLRSGLRCVPLLDEKGKSKGNYAFASLLVRIKFKPFADTFEALSIAHLDT